MFNPIQIACSLLLISNSLVEATSISKNATGLDYFGDVIPIECVPSCNTFENTTVICTITQAASFNSTSSANNTEGVSDPITKLYPCICTDANSIAISTCSACMSGSITAGNLINKRTQGLLNGSVLASYNSKCSLYSQAINKTWTNATNTTSGGFEGNGSTVSFPSPSSNAFSAATGLEVTLKGMVGLLGLVAAVGLIL